jgi:acyl-CoA synthetase
VRPFEDAVVAEYTAAGFWDPEPLAERIATNASRQPDRLAFAGDGETMTWREYHERSGALARQLSGAGLGRDDFVAVLLPDGPAVHAIYVAAERAGVIVVGMGPRARANEIHHMLRVTGCRTLVTEHTHRGTPAAELAADLRARGADLERHLVLDGCVLLEDGEPVPEDSTLGPAAALGPDDLCLVNSTSGTTGLPKCVMQTQNRWKYFHQLAVAAGDMNEDDRFLGLVPAPYGFGLWTAHFTPALLGAPTVTMRDFDAEGALELIERHQITVIACVSTQFVMMLNSPGFHQRELGSLRSMFTGGERVPTERARVWEEATGSLVLQFYGSNESGAVSRTTVEDSAELRLTTAGRTIRDMGVRLLEPGTGELLPEGAGRGICAVRGPAMTPGYYADEAANRELFRADGLMVCADIVEIDSRGYLTVVGRQSDFIIRGGQNVSAQAVEEVVERHPSVGVAGVVGMPDEVYGERVCAFVELRDGELELADLTGFLEGEGVSKYMWPERLVVVDSVPRGANGKVDKAGLRERAAALAGAGGRA